MELTLDSAFSPGGMVGNLSYILLIASMAMRDMFWLRLLAIFSGIAGIAYDVIWLRDPVGTFWETAFTLTNLVQWILLVREERKFKLLPEERKLHERFFSALSEKECKTLLRNSDTLILAKDTFITRKGDKPENFFMLLAGEVTIRISGQPISSCHPGDLLGEMSFLTGAVATADSVMASDGEVLEIGQTELTKLIKQSPELGTAVNDLISRNLVIKLERANTLATAGSL